MMYITGTNCNGEYIVIMTRHELNSAINSALREQRRLGRFEEPSEEDKWEPEEE